MADHAAAYAQAAEGGEASPLAPLRRKLYLMSMNSFLMRLHRDCTKITKLLETWAGQSQFYENIDQGGFAEQYGLTVDELHAERDAAKKAWMKYRAKKLNQDRTRKHNIDEALEQWGIRTVEDTHKKLASIDKEKARLEALEKSIASRGEPQAMIAERLAMWEAERHCRFQSNPPGIPRLKIPDSAPPVRVFRAYSAPVPRRPACSHGGRGPARSRVRAPPRRALPRRAYFYNVYITVTKTVTLTKKVMAM